MIFRIRALTLAAAAAIGAAAAAADTGPGARALFESSLSGSNPGSDIKSYAGISYALVSVKPGGGFTILPRSRTFKEGDQIKILVRTTRPGQLRVMALGAAGPARVLFAETVEGTRLYEIPKNTVLRFAGDPGTEKLVVLFSTMITPVERNLMPAASSPPAGPEKPQSSPLQPAASPDFINFTPLILDEALKGFGETSKRDPMNTGYAVLSRKTGWKMSTGETGEIRLESDRGTHYGVLPASILEEGGIVALGLSLKYR